MDEDAYGLNRTPEESDEPSRTPWERPDGSFPADLFRSWMQAMARPGEFFGSLDPDISLARPLIFYLVFSVFGSAASTLSWLAIFGDSYREAFMVPGLEGFPVNAYLWMNFFFSPFLALITLLFHVGLVHVGVRIFVPGGQPIGVTTRTLCYVAAPWVLAIVPIIGWGVSSLWMVTLAIIGIQRTHRTTFGRAFAAVIVPAFVLTVVLTMIFVLLGVFLAMVIGGTV